MRRLLDIDHIHSLTLFDTDPIYTKYIPLGFLGPAGRGNRFVMIEAAGALLHLPYAGAMFA